MIGTVTLNPAVDRRYLIEKLDLNIVERTSDYSATAGGKGLNVSRVLRLFGEEVLAFGFLGGSEGIFISNEIQKLGINSHFVEIEGSTRTCLNIMDKEGNNIEVLEKGPQIDNESIDKLLIEFKRNISSLDVITISGSLPLGVENNIYGKLIEVGNKEGVKTILDTSNKVLLDNLKFSPYLVKPNKKEIENIAGFKLKDEEDIIRAGNKVLELGARNVAISLGSMGMYFIGEEGNFKVNIPEIKVKNPVGSGDSSVAGFAYGLAKGLDINEVFKIANGCGMANAMEKETGYIDFEVMKKLVEDIQVIKI
ncbi:1-phosphofructokinase [Clostridium sp. D2Q-14]|uniref:1-phosphofructokinase n=1 Tax=Anaeromonas gelatinilytica TaxID=2683194 RepID=UPI00193C4C35|nr:1-phosphofructokinase [Anaeromonas gelatinilytica]MBS4535750.1 1-phosphofructokinase [Anaeromonas gelatinilytica]